MDEILTRLEQGEGEEYGSDEEAPGLDEEPYILDNRSDSSDCDHEGNGLPCRSYNRDGCLKKDSCEYSHAPDDKSYRDKL